MSILRRIEQLQREAAAREAEAAGHGDGATGPAIPAAPGAPEPSTPAAADGQPAAAPDASDATPASPALTDQPVAPEATSSEDALMTGAPATDALAPGAAPMDAVAPEDIGAPPPPGTADVRATATAAAAIRADAAADRAAPPSHAVEADPAGDEAATPVVPLHASSVAEIRAAVAATVAAAGGTPSGAGPAPASTTSVSATPVAAGSPVAGAAGGTRMAARSTARDDLLRDIRIRVRAEASRQSASLAALSGPELRARIETMVDRLVGPGGFAVTRDERLRLTEDMLAEIEGFGPIEPFLKDESTLSVVVLPEPVPPETKMLSRASTEARRNSNISAVAVPNRMRSSTV
jgi:hypothetical protein